MSRKRRKQKKLLPVIKEFNLAVERALKDVYDAAHRYYEFMKTYDSSIEVEARLLFSNIYPRHRYFALTDFIFVRDFESSVETKNRSFGGV